MPSGGQVVAGNAQIGAPTGGSLTINQSSSKAIINWTGFSIGQGGAVQFNNGAGATLNRVTGTSLSSIDGLLSATGSVYLINPNGVIIGKSGVVNVGGTFVASTLGVTDQNFLAGGDLTFTGSSAAGVINYGKVGALGGDVALIAATVNNAGTITAENGVAGLVSGYSVLMRDASLDDGRFSVLVGGAGTSVTNGGTIAAANAELRAEQGNVYALAGNTAGVIRATGVSAGDGHVRLVAEGGTLDLGGVITAQGPNGAPGAIETSGQTVNMGQVAIDAHGGTWTVDPYDLTIDSTAASSIDAALNNGTSVVEQTNASSYSGLGIVYASGVGNINVDAPLSWSTSASLTLSAYRDVVVNASIGSTGGGGVTLYADNTGTGVGAVNFGQGVTVSTSGAVNLFYNPASNPTGSAVNTTSYTNPTSYGSDVTGGATLTAYMLVNTVYDLQNVRNNLWGAYALGRDIDASSTAKWNNGTGFVPIGTCCGPFSGSFNGQSHVISGLTINNPSLYFVGLFGDVESSIGSVSISNVTLENEAVLGGQYVGGLVGYTQGFFSSGKYSILLSNDSVTGTISGSVGNVGGLVGYLESSEITNSHANATVSSSSSAVGGLVGIDYDSEIVASETQGTVSGTDEVGGLVGRAFADSFTNSSYSQFYVLNSYSTSNVISELEFAGSPVSGVGGLVGSNATGIAGSYATGKVSTNGDCAASGACAMGGLVGSQLGGAVSSSYFDTQTTGLTVGVGGSQASQAGVTGLTTAQFTNAANFTGSGWTFGGLGSSANWVIVDADMSLNNANGAAGGTRPMLLNEYSTTIANAHQLQLMALAPAATYTQVGDIDARGSGDSSDVWGLTGFVPVGQGSTPFTGSLNGQGYTIQGLTINNSLNSDVGLFGINYGELSNIGIVGGSIVASAGNASVGSIAGVNGGQITGAFATSSVAAVGSGSKVGGLVGANQGDIRSAYATGNVSAATDTSSVGGLVGYNAPAQSSGANPFYVLIDSSYATGAVSAPGGSLGGLVGVNDGNFGGNVQITSSYATGAVNATAPVTGNRAQVGGLVGYNNADYGFVVVASDYATGAVTAHGVAAGGSGLEIGGLVGANVGGQYSNSAALVTDSYAAGAVTAGDSGAAGINGVNAGGLVGANIGFGGVAQVGLDYALGAVTVGAAQNGATARAGGLIGYNDGGDGRASVMQVYAAGAVSGGAGAQTGGLIGYNYANGGTATVADGYFDTQTTLQSIDGAMATGGDATTGSIGLTTAQFMDATSPISGLQLGTLQVSGPPAYFVIIDADGTLNGSNGATRPLLINEYQTTITNAHQLQLMALVPDGTYTLAANIDASATAGRSDVWGPGGFVPVGQGSTPFAGVLNGAGHTVSGLTIADANATDVGLLGLSSGLVENITLAGASVSGGSNVGALVGYNSGTVSGASGGGRVTGASQVGGLVGYNSGTISGSLGKANVSGATSAASQLGGLVGTNSGTLTGDYATGAVAGNAQVGGLVGVNSGTITASYAIGAVNGASGKTAAGAGSAIGGLVGDNQGAVSTSYATGAVTGYDQVGGLVGYNHGAAQVASSYATGAVNGASGKNTPSGSGAKVGGLIGENAASLATADSYATGKVAGSAQVGGLIGLNDGSGVVQRVYATGPVNGISAVGGLIGENSGQVVSGYATGAVGGISGKGLAGLVGQNAGSGQISTSYATGGGGAGLVGINNGALANDVFDSGSANTATAVTSGSSTGVTAIGGSTGLSPYAVSSYAGFDFSSTWTIDAGTSRPFLQANPQSPPPS